MNNILSFPMNVWEVAKERDESTREQSLLSMLSYLRDCLESGDITDPEILRKCSDMSISALEAAMSAERTILTQRLHIEEMDRVASTDQLTGAYNRRGFELECKRILSSAKRYDETGVLIYIDLDGFKPINDTYGHAAGDQVLVEVVRVLSDNIRPTDFVARLGGDEFAVLLTRTPFEDGLARAERLKNLINSHYVRFNDKNISVRASFGIQRYGADSEMDKLLGSADSAMYEAKRMQNDGDRTRA